MTERGFVKRTPLGEYKPQGRAGKGVAIGKIDPVGTGFTVGIAQVLEHDELNVIQISGALTKLELKNVKAESRTKVGTQRVPILFDDYTTRIILG